MKVSHSDNANAQALTLSRGNFRAVHPLRKFRERLRLSQRQFADKIARSEPTIRAYERGADPPDDVLAKIRALSPSDFDAVFNRSAIEPAPEDEEWHRRLHAILRSGNTRVIDALKSNMVVFHDVVAGVVEEPIPGVKVHRKIRIGANMHDPKRAQTS